MCLCVLIYAEERVPEPLSEILQTEKGGEEDFRQTTISMLDTFPSWMTCALKTSIHVWLFRDAVLVSRVTKKNMSPH